MFTCDFLYYKKNIREVLENKVTQLEAKVTRLEATVKHQESLLNILQTDLPLKAISGSAVIPFAGRSSVSRTCQELRAIDPSLPSGMYWIDPDGQGVGDDAIYVQCDMTSGTQMRKNLKKKKKKRKNFIRLSLTLAGSTSVSHNSESPTNVEHCADPGCYSRAITYSASSRQIKALSRLSAECHQSIKVSFIT